MTTGFLLPSEISIHAPLRGRLVPLYNLTQTPDFNPRPLAGATGQALGPQGVHNISIHAPLRGRPRPVICRRWWRGISIHAPLRGRLPISHIFNVIEQFQSTPPCGGDLYSLLPGRCMSRFQSTPPCGGDWWICRKRRTNGFQSTPPCGGDTGCDCLSAAPHNFNPRPLAGATVKGFELQSFATFQSTPPCGGDVRRGIIR